MRRLLVVGIGSGDPEHLTLGAVRALNEADAIIVADKGDVATELREARLDLCRRVIDPRHRYRLVEVEVGAVRDRNRATGGYAGSIAAWRAERVRQYAVAIGDLGEHETGAFLAWGDATLYDPTLAVLEEVRAAGALEFSVGVIPGISSVSALAARHGIAVTSAGGTLQVTTGRRIADDGWPHDADAVAVLVDTHDAIAHADDDAEIYWGAFVGLATEQLIHGRVGDQREAIAQARAALRAEHGWLFDTYLVRHRDRR